MGAAAERKSSGKASVTLAPAGKAMIREASMVALSETVELQGRVVARGGCVRLGMGTVHAPAVLALLPTLPQQPHMLQPGVSSAEAAQQQPPRHSPEPQSKALPHASPGEKAMQAPSEGAHAAQPARAALAVQHVPPRHAPDAHVASPMQVAPAAASAGKAALDVTLAVAAEEAAPTSSAPLALASGEALPLAEAVVQAEALASSEALPVALPVTETDHVSAACAGEGEAPLLAVAHAELLPEPRNEAVAEPVALLAPLLEALAAAPVGLAVPV